MYKTNQALDSCTHARAKSLTNVKLTNLKISLWFSINRSINQFISWKGRIWSR